MNNSIKFPIVCFGLQIVVVALAYIFFPMIYPGDTFMIVVLHFFNFIIGIILFPLYYFLIGKKIKKNAILILANLICILVIVNLLPLITGHLLYTAKLIKVMFTPYRMQGAAIIEFINPIISFIITSLFIPRLKPRNVVDID